MKHISFCYFTLYLLLTFLLCCQSKDVSSGNPQDGSTTDKKKAQNKGSNGGSCYKGDLVCEKDKLGYEAISTLHHQMDDDENGDIDLEESAEFLREELQYTGSKSQWSEHRSKTFHMNDTHITVDDLWAIWKNSSVHNWTIEQVVTWLTYDVELPQYTETFKMNAVDGSTLPRLAVNNLNFVSNILGIKNLVHKQKLVNKATDVVLFGPPKSRHNWYKDVALVTAILVAAGGCWFAYRQNKQLETNMAKTMRDMDSLARSENALKELQEKLEREELEKQRHIQHKEQLKEKIEHEMSEVKAEAEKFKLSKEQTETQLTKMKETHAELEQTRRELFEARKELEVRSSLTPSAALQRWLQISYELELKVYNEKKTLAEQQLLNAKESCERLRKKKQALFGSLRMVHSGYMDETENMIITAKKALEEVKHDLAERQYRWQQIENMCAFSIISNPGIKELIQSTGHTDLYRYCHGGSLLESVASAELDDFDDISPASVVAAGSSSSNRASATRRNLIRGVPSSSRSSASDGQSSRGGSMEPVSPPPPSLVDEEEEAESGDELESTSPINSAHDSELGDNSAQPNFSLYPDDLESTNSSSSNDNTSNIPNRVRPPLQRNAEQVYLDDSADEARTRVRVRTHTNESLPARPRRVHTVNSPLATNGLSNSESIIVTPGSTKIKRSRTTDAQFKPNRPMTGSMSQDCLSKPDSAPASLITHGNESDTSFSSKEGSDTGRTKKVRKKIQLFKMFKSKPLTS